jgi:hydrophobic/amphiphilic exporter-1 (mainly G- bacteria), HAE1 family
MFKKFIERPVLSTVISILLVIVGVLGLTKLPLERFPNIAPPAVLVSAVYPGANAETILRSVTPSLPVMMVRWASLFTLNKVPTLIRPQ